MRFDNENEHLAERVAATRANGLPDWMAKWVKIINGIPEWRPPEDKLQEKIAAAVPNRRPKRRGPAWPNHG